MTWWKSVSVLKFVLARQKSIKLAIVGPDGLKGIRVRFISWYLVPMQVVWRVCYAHGDHEDFPQLSNVHETENLDLKILIWVAFFPWWRGLTKMRKNQTIFRQNERMILGITLLNIIRNNRETLSSDLLPKDVTPKYSIFFFNANLSIYIYIYIYICFI